MHVYKLNKQYSIHTNRCNDVYNTFVLLNKKGREQLSLNNTYN